MKLKIATVCLALFSHSVVGGETPSTITEAVNKLPAPIVEDALTLEYQNVNVGDSSMAYLEQGEGDAVVFLHGNPTSSYLWRNIIPIVAKTHRAIAPDLIGMGQSGKPNIDYSFKDHYEYLSAFIDELELEKITIVAHDWGAALGFEYAKNNPKKVKRIAFMEGLLPPVFPQPSFDAMGEEMGGMFRAFKDPDQGKELVIEQHIFVEKILPNFVNRTLSEKAMEFYRAPYLNMRDRKPILAWPRSVPIANEPAENAKVLVGIKQFMQKTKKPMLLVYASPGVLVNEDVKNWYVENIKKLETAYVGQGLHFIQEDQPDAIGRAISDWLRRH